MNKTPHRYRCWRHGAGV